MLRLTNKERFTEHTPQVFLSGALHGNERVGPTAVVEFATLLLQVNAPFPAPCMPPRSSRAWGF